MKKILFLLSFIFLINCNAIGGDEYEIKGSIKNATQKTVYLEKMSHNEVKIVDSSTIGKLGEFKLKGNIDGIGFYRIFIKDITNPQGFSWFLTLDKSEKATATIDLKTPGNYTIEGTPAQKEFQDMMKSFSSQQGEIMQLYQQYQSISKSNPNSTDAQSIATMLQTKSQNMNNYIDGLLKTAVNPITKYYLYSVILEQMKNQPSNPELMKQVSSFSDELTKKLPNSVYAKDFQMIMSNFETQNQAASNTSKLEIGAEAPDVEFVTEEGKKVTLKSFRGKAVLLDFWASWCGPCRMENPNVVRAYNAYKNKGFTVISVSQDSDLAKWKAAIAKDGLVWTSHYADKLNGNKASQLYEIQYIPKAYLIDKNGIIVAKDLRGNQLDIELEKLLK